MAENLVVKIGADLSGLDAGIKEAANTVSSFGDVLKGSFLGGLGANLATSAFDMLKGSVTEAIHALAEVDKIGGQTAAVIKSTGGAAGVTADAVANLADQLERKTGVEAESIQRGQNLLLTFTNIKDAAGAGNDIFTQTTKIMTDLGVAMGTDASSAAIQLGKALNDPTQGITALTRVGVSFTDAQKEQIKALQESGNIMGAQKIILAELQKEFGGSAEAAGKTFAGALDRAKNALGSITEAMMTPAVPGFTAALGKLSDAAYAVSDAITKGNFMALINEAFGPGSKALVLGLATAIGVTMAQSMQQASRQAAAMAAGYARAAAAMVVANAPVLAAIAAISFAAYPFIKNWDNVVGVFGTIWQTMKGMVTNAMTAISTYSKAGWEIISGHFRAAYSNFVSFFIGPVARAFNTLFAALPQQVRDAIGSFKFEMPKIDLSATGVADAFETLTIHADTAFKYVDTGANWVRNQMVKTWGSLPGDIASVMDKFTSVIAGSSAQMAGSLKTVGAAAGDMGDAAKAGHEKAAKATKVHADKVQKLDENVGELGRGFAGLFTIAGSVNRVIAAMKAAEKAKELQDYIDAQRDMTKVAAEAFKKIDDMDKVTKYFGDTTDKAAQKQDILRSAIETLIASGLDQADPRIQALRKAYDDLNISQQAAAQKSVDFGTGLKGVGDAITAVTGTFAFFGGGDSPIVGFLTKVQDGINLFNTWVQGINGVQMALNALGGMDAVIGVLANPVTLIVGGLALLTWAANDAAAAFGGWPKVFDAITIGWQKFGLAFATIGEAIVGGTINFIGWAWTELVNGIKNGANFIIDAINGVIDGINAMLSALPENMGGGARIGRLERFATEEFKPIQIDFTSKLKADIEQTQARLDQAPAMKEWRVSNPIADIAGAINSKLTPAVTETIAQSPVVETSSKYRLQSLQGDMQQSIGTAPANVTVNYYGSGKWTRDDATQLGALIVNELKTAGVR